VVDVCEPFTSILRLTGGSVPNTGKLYWKMYQADLGVQESTLNPALKQSIRERIHHRWTMLHSDLHSAGFVLDPEYQLFQQHENEEVMTGFHNIIEKIYKDDVPNQVANRLVVLLLSSLFVCFLFSTCFLCL